MPAALAMQVSDGAFGDDREFVFGHVAQVDLQLLVGVIVAALRLLHLQGLVVVAGAVDAGLVVWGAAVVGVDVFG